MSQVYNEIVTTRPHVCLHSIEVFAIQASVSTANKDSWKGPDWEYQKMSIRLFLCFTIKRTVSLLLPGLDGRIQNVRIV